jgi:iron-sulfur cluster assembly protein
MITLTASASAKVREIMLKEEKSDWKLRMGVRGSGCSGMKYVLGFDSEIHEQDEEFTQDGITLVCDPQSYMYLKGTEIDFQSGEEGEGFVIKNPNVMPSGCNCGESQGGECGSGCGDSCGDSCGC